MVTYDAFRGWLEDAGFQSIETASPYIDETVDDDFDMVLVYDDPTGDADGHAGQAYMKPETLYNLFEPVWEDAASVDDVSIADLRDHYDAMAGQDDHTVTQRYFVEKERTRSHLDYWEEQGFFENDTASADEEACEDSPQTSDSDVSIVPMRD